MDDIAKPIPRILHQTWKETSVPQKWKFAVDSWRTFHPEWTCRWWTDEMNQAFVESVFPEFLPTWEQFTYPIQRADAIRYLLLYHFGGIYADLDLECIRELNSLLEPGYFIAGREPEKHIAESSSELLCNAFMAAPPGHPFLKAVIDDLQTCNGSIVTLREVLESTGPAFLHRSFQKYSGDDVRVKPPVVFYPISSRDTELKSVCSDTIKGDKVRRSLVSKGAYTIHYWSNFWVSGHFGALINPDPFRVPGFTFFPGRDSPGSDVFHCGRNIPEVARRCLADPEVCAFNTDGFAKDNLSPRGEWVFLEKSEPGIGLYIKSEHIPPWTALDIFRLLGMSIWKTKQYFKRVFCQRTSKKG